MSLVEHRVELLPISVNRWNTLLGLEKGTEFRCIPGTGLGAIFVNGRLRAISTIETEGDLHVYGGCWEIRNG